MERRHLIYFLAVAEAGTISAAARDLGLSQPTVSQAIADLESSLGMPLFTRAHGMTLTSAGRAFEAPARRALRALDAARWSVEEIKGLYSGELDIGCVTNTAVVPVSELIATYARKAPAINVRVHGMNSGNPDFEALRHGAIEFLFAENTTPPRGVERIEIKPHAMAVVLPPGTDIPERPMRLDELGRYSWIASPYPPSVARGTLSVLLADAGLPDVQPTIELAYRQAVVPLVLAGVGVAVMSVPEARIAQRAGAVYRTLEQEFATAHACYWTSENLSPAGRMFLSICRDAL